MKKIYKNSIYNVIYRVTNLIFPLITASYVARILLPEGVGYFSYINTNVSYFVALASLGLPVYGVREIAKAKNDRDKLNQTYTELFIVNIFFTLFSCIIYLLFVSMIFNIEDLAFYLICGIQVILNAINIDWMYQGYEDYSYIAKRNIIIKILFFILIILLVKNKEDLFIYAAISVLVTFIQYIYSIIHARKIVSLKFDSISLKNHFKPVLILGVTVIFATIYNKIDITMLGILKNDAEVGLYTNAHKCIELITVLCASITGVYLPTLSKSYTNDKKEFNSILEKGFDIVCFLAIPAACGIFIVAPEVMRILFGTRFINGYTTIRCFVPIIIIRSLGDLFCYQTLIAIGKEDKRVFANIITTIINITLNIILIPKLGRNGAAIASVLSELFINTYLFVYIKKTINLKLKHKSLLVSIISTAIMSFICCLIIGLQIVNPIINVVICIMVSVAVYFLSYYLFNKCI